MRRLILSLAVVGMLAGGAQADGLPVEERGADTTRWLAVAFVAEAGWADPKHQKAEADHRAIFHVLKRRWSRLRKRWPKRFERFVDVLKNYVAALDPRTTKGTRVRWLHALHGHMDMTVAPAGWPQERARWSVHREWWKAALLRARRCTSGRECRDPYRGRALHWGGAMDVPRGCMVELPNAGTFNTFYRLDRDCRRRR